MKPEKVYSTGKTHGENPAKIEMQDTARQSGERKAEYSIDGFD